jgi:transposase-like protein
MLTGNSLLSTPPVRAQGRTATKNGYPASEKLELIKLVERSHLPLKRTLDKLGIARTTFYRWYDRYQSGGPERHGIGQNKSVVNGAP